MSDDTLSRLKALDVEILKDIVRKDQANQAFEITDWVVKPLGHVIMNPNTGGLYRFSGVGRDEIGEKEWSVILKISKSNDTNVHEIEYWKREALAFQNRLFEKLPKSISMPRCYGVIEHADQIWIWMEPISEITPREWELGQYAFVARKLCSFNTAYLNDKPLPDFPWLCKKYFDSLTVENSFFHKLMDATQPDTAWDASAVQKIFPTKMKQRIIQQWNEKDIFLAGLDRLPEVFCHNDFHRRNLMIRSNLDKSLEVVALDWAFSGNGPLGGDLGWLIGGSLFYFEWEPAKASELLNCCLESYLTSLIEAGMDDLVELAKIGCLISLAIRPGMLLPAFSFGYTEFDYYPETAKAQFGRAGDELVAGWAEVSEFCIDCADQAQQILKKLDW